MLIDINWRPVFFEDEAKAKETILPYVEKGDILKMSDEEAEWLYGIPRDTALHHPEKVTLSILYSLWHLAVFPHRERSGPMQSTL